ncbi:Uncharacterised protein [Vibrio cholerae]|nr:Uncharacterised protein [Vibrio cholerae]
MPSCSRHHESLSNPRLQHQSRHQCPMKCRVRHSWCRNSSSHRILP